MQPNKKRRPGEISVLPREEAIPAQAGTKQARLIDLLARPYGASMEDLQAVCTKKDGTPWKPNSVKNMCYWDLKNKGYGTRTEWNGDEARYFLILPSGLSAPVPHILKGPRLSNASVSSTNRKEESVHNNLNFQYTRDEIMSMSKAQRIEKLKSMTQSINSEEILTNSNRSTSPLLSELNAHRGGYSFHHSSAYDRRPNPLPIPEAVKNVNQRLDDLEQLIRNHLPPYGMLEHNHPPSPIADNLPFSREEWLALNENLSEIRTLIENQTSNDSKLTDIEEIKLTEKTFSLEMVAKKAANHLTSRITGAIEGAVFDRIIEFFEKLMRLMLSIIQYIVSQL